MPSISGDVKKRIAGALLIALGVWTLTTPLVAGRWSLAVLGLPLIAMGVAEAYIAFTSPRSTEASAYLPCALAFLAGNVLLLSSALVSHGLLVLLIAILAVDGIGKIIAAWRGSGADRFPLVFNGLVDLGCATAIWYLSRFIGLVQAVGIIVGAYILAAGWRLLMEPVELAAPDSATKVLNVHPDPGLGVPGNETFARLRSETDSGSQFVRAADLLWMSTLGIVFLAIHAGRMPLTDDMLGRISPFVATVGDVLMTLVFAAAVMLPARLAWRRLTRPVERLAWTLRLGCRTRGYADKFGGRPADASMAGSPIWFQLASARRASLAAVRADPVAATRPAVDRLLRRVQPDLGFQLVLQHGKLGDRDLSEIDGVTGRSVACQHD